MHVPSEHPNEQALPHLVTHDPVMLHTVLMKQCFPTYRPTELSSQSDLYERIQELSLRILHRKRHVGMGCAQDLQLGQYWCQSLTTRLPMVLSRKSGSDCSTLVWVMHRVCSKGIIGVSLDDLLTYGFVQEVWQRQQPQSVASWRCVKHYVLEVGVVWVLQELHNFADGYSFIDTRG